jgi:hypothetical protein
MTQPGDVTPQMLRDAMVQVRGRLDVLEWEHGLTRNDIRAQVPDFPMLLYLRLPDSKRFTGPQEMWETARNALIRADGEFVGDNAADTLPSAQEIEDIGAPAAWGDDPLLEGETEDSGSATDTEGLDPSTEMP